jgi:tetratricopeptide (TPR) repeat protein
MEIEAKLVDLLQRAHEEEWTFFASLSDDERSAIGTPEHWSVKDVAAHLAEWKARTGQRLVAARRGEAPPTYDDVDEANAKIFEQYRNQSWTDVLKALERANSELVELTRAMPEGDLVDAERFPWQDGRPLWRSIVGSGYSHSVQHLAQLYVERGERDYATQIQETAAELLVSLDDSPSWRGVAIYNLACHYALCGEREKAIAKLGQALRLNPDLTEWSKQDPDFASVREEPAYRSLYVA